MRHSSVHQEIKKAMIFSHCLHYHQHPRADKQTCLVQWFSTFCGVMDPLEASIIHWKHLHSPFTFSSLLIFFHPCLEHRTSTKISFPSYGVCSNRLQVWFIFFFLISTSRHFCQVFLGLSCFLFPWRFQVRACLVMFVAGLWIVCHNHLQRILVIIPVMALHYGWYLAIKSDGLLHAWYQIKNSHFPSVLLHNLDLLCRSLGSVDRRLETNSLDL